ncbi:MAG TPA: bifunctional 4-hydroxy-2-oxoglutarate aldolase/2-dehydro-3-deoxy-phosphogluconate aldolase [Micromonospora sp.]
MPTLPRWPALGCDDGGVSSRITVDRGSVADEAEGVGVNLRDALDGHRLLAVVRSDDPDAALEAVLVLVEAGIGLVEVCLASRDSVGVLLRARAELGPEALLGAGAVLTEGDVVAAEQAGASFIVTPGMAPAVGEAVRLGLPALVGAVTPTEVIAASLAGAAAVEVFPAGLHGPGYLRTLRDCFPECCFVASGGVDSGSVPAYLAAGASAVAVDQALLGDGAHGGDLDALRERVAAFRSAL